ncbi:MAG: acyl-CoA ligase (AMP-forming), exosortase A system-associated [Gammaproteobacteria bacterium]|nr:acyl-CoA ligase (AMP-forming), exosortase A system-associated [Gammaproteobacteria bacterium]
MTDLLHQLIEQTAKRSPGRIALIHKTEQLTYQQLDQQMQAFAQQLLSLDLQSGDRVAVYLPKQFETVIALFGAQQAGGVMVPVNPQLKPKQVSHILNDSQARVLVTSSTRYEQIKPEFADGNSLTVILIDKTVDNTEQWLQTTCETKLEPHRRISKDLAALLYTSGSTGQPKGVMLSHLNMVEGAKSVAHYLENSAEDRLLALLPLSFDYGLSQLTTAFLTGASVVLLDYLLPRDVIKAVVKYEITGLAAVPPVWIQLADLDWPEEAQSIRYFTNSGGAMPPKVVETLQTKLPAAKPFLMYGLTEAFRSSYLEPNQVTKRPTSIGKAIPNAQLLVINADGELCEANQPGELVHRGVHVSMGYWQAPEKTAEKFRPLPELICQQLGIDKDEIAVWSGDTVMQDEQGYLYFAGRQDEMIKSSGYRISPAEIEDELYHLAALREIAAFGLEHPKLGQAVCLAIAGSGEKVELEQAVLQRCRAQLPNFMMPQAIFWYDQLPKNPNGKLDRAGLSKTHAEHFNG